MKPNVGECVSISQQKFWWIYYWNEPEWFPLSRYFPIIVFENLRWNWNLGQLCFVFALNLFPRCTAHKSATHRAVQWQNVKCTTAVQHTKEAMLPTKQFFLYCVVVPIWISTFTFHGLLNFCAHAFLKLWLVLQISTLKASILLDFLVWTKRSFETRPVIWRFQWTKTILISPIVSIYVSNWSVTLRFCDLEQYMLS